MIRDNVSLERAISHPLSISKSFWFGNFPPYMGVLAQKVIEDRQSPLASLLSDSVVSKLWNQSISFIL